MRTRDRQWQGRWQGAAARGRFAAWLERGPVRSPGEGWPETTRKDRVFAYVTAGVGFAVTFALSVWPM